MADELTDSDYLERRFKAPAMRLIDAAERLFGESGIDTVPLQQIAEASGQSNKFAVQYHFGSREGLIAAIFQARLPLIVERRRIMLKRMEEAGRIGLRDLLWAFFWPVVAQVDAEGKHRYARFSGQVRSDPGYRSAFFSSPHLSSVTEVLERIRAAIPHLPQADFEIRIMLCIDLFDSALRMLDRGSLPLHARAQSGPPPPGLVLENALSACVAALEQPRIDGWSDLMSAAESPGFT